MLIVESFGVVSVGKISLVPVVLMGKISFVAVVSVGKISLVSDTGDDDDDLVEVNFFDVKVDNGADEIEVDVTHAKTSLV